MYQRYKERFGTAGVVLGVIALILALGGTALAASKLNGTQKKEVEKIAKKFQGTGPAGAAGKDGTNGTNGKDGTNGTAGAPGAAGKSVALDTENPGVNCEEGGTSVEVEGTGAKKYVCNGKEGEEGDEGEKGDPWSPDNTLPVGATETGTWVFNLNESDEGEIYVPLSFPVQLAAPLTAGHVHYESEANFADFEAGGEVVGCDGNTGAPKAPSGHLCVYGQGNVSNATFEAIWNISVGAKGTSSRTGALLVFERGAAGVAFGSGSFAVTG